MAEEFVLPKETVENLNKAIIATNSLTENLRMMNATLERMMVNKEDVEDLARTLNAFHQLKEWEQKNKQGGH